MLSECSGPIVSLTGLLLLWFSDILLVLPASSASPTDFSTDCGRAIFLGVSAAIKLASIDRARPCIDVLLETICCCCARQIDRVTFMQATCCSRYGSPSTTSLRFCLVLVEPLTWGSCRANDQAAFEVQIQVQINGIKAVARPCLET